MRFSFRTLELYKSFVLLSVCSKTVLMAFENSLASSSAFAHQAWAAASAFSLLRCSQCSASSPPTAPIHEFLRCSCGSETEQTNALGKRQSNRHRSSGRATQAAAGGSCPQSQRTHKPQTAPPGASPGDGTCVCACPVHARVHTRVLRTCVSASVSAQAHHTQSVPSLTSAACSMTRPMCSTKRFLTSQEGDDPVREGERTDIEGDVTMVAGADLTVRFGDGLARTLPA